MNWFPNVLIVAALLAPPAASSSFVYTSLAAWQSSGPGNTTVLDFESATPAYYTTFAYSPYSFTASSGFLYVAGGAAPGTGSGRFLTTLDAQTINLTLAASVYGVSFNLGSNASIAAPASIIATDVNGIQYITNVTTSAPAGPAIFWGLRADTQLASVKIAFTTAQPQLDNIRYANVPVTPEPAPWALLATGGGVLFFLRRRPATSKSARSSTPNAQKLTATGSHPTNK